MSTHNSFFTFNLFLAGPPNTDNLFGTVLAIVEEPAGFTGTWLNGADYLAFNSATGVADALTADYIDVATSDKLSNALSQIPSGTTVLLTSFLASTPATEEDAYDAALLDPVMSKFWAVVTYHADGASAAPHEAIAAKVAQRNFGVHLVETDEATLASGAIGASGLDGLEDITRAGVTFSNTDDSPTLGICCKALAFDLGTTSPAFAGRLVPSEQNSPVPTSAQYNQLIANNVNLVSEMFTSATVFYPGVLTDGRGISEVLFADFVKYELENGLKAAHLDRLDSGNPIKVDLEGQSFVEGLFISILGAQAASGKIVQGQFTVTAEDITQTDRDNNRLRFTIAFQVGQNVIRFSTNVYANRSPVVV